MKRKNRGGARTKKTKKNKSEGLFRQDIITEEFSGLGGLEAIPDTQVFFPPRETALSEDTKYRLEAIRRAWKTLSEQQKKILEIIENWDYTTTSSGNNAKASLVRVTKEISKRLKISRSSVAKQIERAREKILKFYETSQRGPSCG